MRLLGRMMAVVVVAAPMVGGMPSVGVADQQRFTAKQYENVKNARVAYRNGNYAEAVRLYRPIAERSGYFSINAQINLGYIYETVGIGVPKDNVEAVKWYRMAAEGGSATGQMFLGKLYDGGRGVAADTAEATKWYLKAAKQGHPEAQTSLAFKYYLVGREVFSTY